MSLAHIRRITFISMECIATLEPSCLFLLQCSWELVVSFVCILLSRTVVAIELQSAFTVRSRAHKHVSARPLLTGSRVWGRGTWGGGGCALAEDLYIRLWLFSQALLLLIRVRKV